MTAQEAFDLGKKAASGEPMDHSKEMAMRDTDAPTHDTIEGLAAYILGLVEQPHDYGTCVYAMSLSAVAAFNFVARKLGVTGFQASCADLDIIRRTRSIKGTFCVIDYEKLLYPQYLNAEHFPDWLALIEKQREWLRTEAVRKLREDSKLAHPNVLAHWRKLVRKGDFIP